jgi:hypothetical protein
MFTLLLFGGIGASDNDKGIVYTDVFALDIDFLVLKHNQSEVNIEELSKKKNNERSMDLKIVGELPEQLTNFELLKVDGVVYLFGGVNQEGRVLEHIMRFVPKDSQFEKINLNFPNIFGFSLYRMYTDLYVVGGFDLSEKGKIKTHRISIFKNFPDPNNAFRKLPAKNEYEKFKPTLTHFEDTLIIAGGVENKTLFFETFNTISNEFATIPFPDDINYENENIVVNQDESYINKLNINSQLVLRGYNSFTFMLCKPKFI